MTALIVEEHLEWMHYKEYAATSVHIAETVLDRADRLMSHGLPNATHEDISNYLSGASLAVWTRRTYDQHFRRFFWWLSNVAERGRDDDPMLGIRRPPLGERVPHPATHEQFEQCLEQSSGVRRLAILIAGREGLRAEECALLKREHITEELVTVRRGKGGKTRRVPTHPDVWAAVKDLPRGQVLRHEDPAVEVTGHWLSTSMSTYLTRRGLSGLHMHRFRSMFATELVRNGVDVLVVSQLLGHADVSTTMVYVGISEAQRRNAVYTLRPLRGPGGDS